MQVFHTFDDPGIAWFERVQSHLRRSCTERLMKKLNMLQRHS